MPDRRQHFDRRMSSSDPEHMVVKMPRIFIGRVESGPHTGQWELFLVGYTHSLDGVRFFFPTCGEAVEQLQKLAHAPGNPLHAWIQRESLDTGS